ncbi:Bug family tripartite tricarboxylate transporter substrate binding protein [Noviherbaspirillum denitrificans]|uniref:ABC transporter substrate-binding protein n=1 Tax=Noviherbaspirillum denitrificans TaxID=1968433 RepID=A0A254TDF0_9BURK|nr:tripartite tricarboxylate transporter substrate binding protein [Noviherbaspirillum denitrificans]OWW19342.1 hypothetical protein AYR66_07325 [Noviherbaspirillum denitrificans]
MKTLIVSALIGLSIAVSGQSALAASWPDKPVKLIVPFPPGGPSDAAARTVAEGLSIRLKQSVIVENHAGAGGTLAAQTVLHAQPDGQTLLWAVASMAVIPLLQKSPPFTTLGDFEPVGMVGRFGFGLFVHPSVPANTVAALTEQARAAPGKLTYATGALSEYLVTTDYMKRTGTDMMRVPYKGGAQAMPDVVAGRVQVFFTPLSLGLQQARAGQLRLLAVLQSTRSPLAPDVPTLDEAGVPGVVLPSWQAVMAPPRTPSSIIALLAGALQQTLQDKDMRARLEKMAVHIEPLAPEQLAKQIEAEAGMWQRFVRDYDIPKE